MEWHGTKEHLIPLEWFIIMGFNESKLSWLFQLSTATTISNAAYMGIVLRTWGLPSDVIRDTKRKD